MSRPSAESWPSRPAAMRLGGFAMGEAARLRELEKAPIQLSLTLTSGATFRLKVPQGSRVEELAVVVWGRSMASGQSVDVRLLLDNKPLEDSRKLWHYNIADGSHLTVVFAQQALVLKVRVLEGHIGLAADSHLVMAFPSDTLGDVKNNIRERFGIAQEQQVLRYNAAPLLDDGRTLHAYNIGDGAELTLLPIAPPTPRPR